MGSILVADVDSWSVEAVVRAADRAGLRVLVAGNGIEALERYRSESPRVAIVDRLLGVLDGAQVCQKIRETLPGKATALFLTGIFDGETARTLRDRGQLSDVLPKPFTADDVFRAIQPFLAAADDIASAPESPFPEATSFAVRENPLTRVLVDLVAAGRSGELAWSDGRLVKSIYLDHGIIVGGRSNGRQDLWPFWSARDPLLPAETRSRLSALAVPGPGPEGWTTYLETKGALRPAEVRASRDRWLLSLVLELLHVRTGRGSFSDGPRPADVLGALDAQALALIALRHAPGEPFEALLPRPLSLLRRVARDGGPRPEEHGVTQVEQELLGLADGTHTLGELLALGRLIQHDVRPFLYGMLNLGALETLPEMGGEAAAVRTVSRMPQEIGTSGIRRCGELDGTPLARVLANISAAGSTGILQLRRATTQISIHVECGRIVFARSNQVDHRLGSVLLSQGLISPEDHERALALQAVHRTRRLGAILLGAGALSLKELHQGLCAQVRSILIEAFLLPEGAYAFMEGALPSDDMVSLDVSTPNLILECLRSLDLDEHMIRRMPADEAMLVRMWEPERTLALLRLKPVEEAVLRAAARGLRVADILRLPRVGKDDAAKAIYALISVGCLEPASAGAVDGIAPSTPEESAEAADAGAQLKPAAAVSADEHRALCARNEELKARLLALEAENRRLRALLSSGQTVNINLLH